MKQKKSIKIWNLRVDPKQHFLAIIVVESQGLPSMKCQTKCAKAIFGGRFLSGTGGSREPPVPVKGLRQLGLGTLGLGT